MNKRDILVIIGFILIMVFATFPIVNFGYYFHWRDKNIYETVFRTIELLIRHWLGQI